MQLKLELFVRLGRESLLSLSLDTSTWYTTLSPTSLGYSQISLVGCIVPEEDEVVLVQLVQLLHRLLVQQAEEGDLVDGVHVTLTGKVPGAHLMRKLRIKKFHVSGAHWPLPLRG